MNRDPQDRCTARATLAGQTLRCVLRPHVEGGHLALLPEGEPSASPVRWLRSQASAPTMREAARASGFTGDSCSACGGMRVVRTGTCATCADCGSNSGCG